MKSPCHDYKDLDCRYNFNWRAERLEIACKSGYQYISEHIIKTYRKTKSQDLTGKQCGKISQTAVMEFLKFAGEPINNRGGFNSGHRKDRVLVEYCGRQCSCDDLARISGLNRTLIYKRLWDGWPVEKAVQTPQMRYRKTI
jgi:hypothetical protein